MVHSFVWNCSNSGSVSIGMSLFSKSGNEISAEETGPWKIRSLKSTWPRVYQQPEFRTFQRKPRSVELFSFRRKDKRNTQTKNFAHYLRVLSNSFHPSSLLFFRSLCLFVCFFHWDFSSESEGWWSLGSVMLVWRFHSLWSSVTSASLLLVPLSLKLASGGRTFTPFTVTEPSMALRSYNTKDTQISIVAI